MARAPRSGSARRRILTAVVLTCALALALAGGTTFAVQAGGLWSAGADTTTLVAPMAVYALVSLGILAVLTVVGWFAIGAILAPLQGIRHAADHLTVADMTQRLPSSGDDGIAGFSQTVNSMLDRLEGSVDTQRQLLDDVRHELKTPITIVRGHLEMMDAADPGDVEATRAIGIGELDRLTRLVEDIDLLAAAEADDYAMAPVDVGALSARIAEMVSVIPGHDWSLTAAASGSVVGDADRLLQAWVQLADNASKYAPEGTPIELGSALDPHELRLWVQDHGPGVPPAARHRIFRRFDRGQRRRSVGGSGLGLAIVDAIAKGHGGSCDVSDTPGGGATFTIRLPQTEGAPVPAPVRADEVIHRGGTR